MRQGFFMWLAILVLAVSVVFLALGSIRSVDDSIELSSLDDSGLYICSQLVLTKSLICDSTSGKFVSTEMIVTPSSNANELQHFIDVCPNHDVRIVDTYNCVGKSFTIEGKSGVYTVN